MSQRSPTLVRRAIPDASATHLWTLLQSAVPNPYGSKWEVAAFREHATSIAALLPDPVTEMVSVLADQQEPAVAVLLEGLFPCPRDLGPTPSHWSSAGGGGQYRYELCLVAVLSLLGEAFSFESQHDGHLVQNIVPIEGEESAQTSWGSKNFLEWHVEDAFSEDRCDYFGLLCLRGAADAATALSPAVQLSLTTADEAILRERRYCIRADDAHTGLHTAAVTAAILEGPISNPRIRFDPLYTTTFDQDDTEAADALKRLGDAVQRASVQHILRPGELLIVDNRRVVHGRTPFAARFDGADRWLLRTSITGASRPTLQNRRTTCGSPP